MSRTIVFGDIHGCYDEFLELLKQIGATDEDMILSLGDIVDRGPKSVELFEYFSTRKNAKVLMGNHERKHLNGVLSYSQEIVKVQFGDKYQAFLDWTKTLDYYHETDEAIIIHAFFEHDKSLSEQRQDVLAGTTSGSRFLEKKYGTDKYWYEFYDGKKPIIYGHHVVGENPKIINNTYGIDTAACHGFMLTAIELPSFKIYQIKVEQDYWKTERVRWQLPVLLSKPWKTMTFDQIQQQIDKLRYIEDSEVQSFLNLKAFGLLWLKGKFPTLLKEIKIKANAIIKKYGEKHFNEIASQYPYKVSLFKARKNQLTIEDLQKQYNTENKVVDLEIRLFENKSDKEIKALSYMSKSKNKNVTSIYMDIYRHFASFDSKLFHLYGKRLKIDKFLEKIYAFSEKDLLDLKYDLQYWNDSQKYEFKEAIRKAKNYEKIILFAKVMYADKWKLQTENSKIYEIYLPIFMFSLFDIRAIDHTYRKEITLKFKTLSNLELGLLKQDVLFWTKSQQQEVLVIYKLNLINNDFYFSLFKSLNSEKWKTKSTNPKVLELYELIVEEEGNGFDFWSLHAEMYFHKFFQHFLEQDWEDLAFDFKNWSTYQLELFSETFLEVPFEENLNLTPNEYLKNYKIPERFNLIIPLLEVAEKRNGDIRLAIFENLEFINKNFEYFLKLNKLAIFKMKRIITLMEMEDWYEDETFELGKKIKKAENE